MQPHKRQKSHWMNIGTVSFSNLLHTPTPYKDAYSRHFFRNSLSPILQDILMKSVCGRLVCWPPKLFGLRLYFRLTEAPLFGRAAGKATCTRWPHPHRVTRVGGAKPGGMGVRVVLRRVGTVATVRVLVILIVVVVGGGAVVLVGVGG